MVNAGFETGEISHHLSSYSKWLDSSGLDGFERNFYLNAVRSYIEFSDQRGVYQQIFSDPRARDGAVQEFLLFQQTQKRLGTDLMRRIIDALDQFYHLVGIGPATLRRDFQMARDLNSKREEESDEICTDEIVCETADKATEDDHSNTRARRRSSVVQLPAPLEIRLEEFQEALIKQGLTEATCKSYVTYVARFMRFVLEEYEEFNEIVADPDARQGALDAYETVLRDRHGYSDSTIAVNRGAIEKYLNYSHKELTEARAPQMVARRSVPSKHLSVPDAFDALVQAIEVEVATLNKKVASCSAQGEYEAASSAIQRAKDWVACIESVRTLQKQSPKPAEPIFGSRVAESIPEWHHAHSPARPLTVDQSHERMRAGLLVDPILSAIEERGGAAETEHLLEKLGDQLKEKVSYQELKRLLPLAREILLDSGKLKAMVPRGVWQLADDQLSHPGNTSPKSVLGSLENAVNVAAPLDEGCKKKLEEALFGRPIDTDFGS